MKLRFSFLAVVLSFFIMSNLYATIIIPLSLDQLVSRSNVVARVRVVDVQVVNVSQLSYIVTTVQIIESFKGGSPGEMIEVWQLGDGVSHVIGDANLRLESEGVILAKLVEGKVYLTNLAQSWYVLQTEEGEIVARQGLEGLSIVDGYQYQQAPAVMRWSELRSELIRLCHGGGSQ